MKRKLTLASALVIFSSTTVLACDLCQRNQPKMLQKITHGPGPQGSMDYVIIAVAMVIVAFTLFYSIKYIVRPREKNPAHIKNIVINPNFQNDGGH